MKPFIPRPYRNDNITIRVHSEKLEKVDRIAACHSMSRSRFINQCIDFALENMHEFCKTYVEDPSPVTLEMVEK